MCESFGPGITRLPPASIRPVPSGQAHHLRLTTDCEERLPTDRKRLGRTAGFLLRGDHRVAHDQVRLLRGRTIPRHNLRPPSSQPLLAVGSQMSTEFHARQDEHASHR